MPFETVPNNYLGVPATGPAVLCPGINALPHDRECRDRLVGTLSLVLTAIDPLHVGNGVLVPITAGGRPELAKDISSLRRRPFIPGSSLKGTVRTLVELLTGATGRAPTRLDAQLELPTSLFGVAAGDERCLRGRVGFDDALVRGEAAVTLMRLRRAFAPRPQRAVGPRIYGPAPPGSQNEVPHLAVKRGAQFVTRLTMMNIDERELGTLALSLGLDGTFCLRIGGGKYHGLGRVEVQVESLRIRQGGSRAWRTLEGDALRAEIERLLPMAAVAAGHRAALDLFRRQMPRSR